MHPPLRPATLLILSSALLSACASDPRVIVSSSGALPASGGFELVADQEGELPSVLSTVSKRLSEHGLRRSTDADYLVHATFALRPGALGIVDPNDPQPAWLRAPERRERPKRHASQLTVSFVERATGRELYHGSATTQPSRSTLDPARLIDAILQPRGPNP